MTEVAVKSIDALQTLHTELVRYAADAQDRIDQMARELRRTQAWLTERERHWGYEVARWQRELTQAQTALQRCVETVERWNKERSYGVDCSEQRFRVSRAADNLDKATKALTNVRYHIKQVNEAGVTFTTYAQRLSGTLEKELPQAAELLNRSVSQLESYANLQISGLASVGSVPVIESADLNSTAYLAAKAALAQSGTSLIGARRYTSEAAARVTIGNGVDLDKVSQGEELGHRFNNYPTYDVSSDNEIASVKTHWTETGDLSEAKIADYLKDFKKMLGWHRQDGALQSDGENLIDARDKAGIPVPKALVTATVDEAARYLRDKSILRIPLLVR